MEQLYWIIGELSRVLGILAGQTHLNWDATIAREGAGRTPFLSAKGREGARRRPFFVHGGARRGAENGNGNTFCPRRAAEGHGEHLNTILSTKGHEGAGRTPFLSAKGREGARRRPFFVHGGARRTTKKTLFCPRRGAEGHGEHLRLFLSTEGQGEQGNCI